MKNLFLIFTLISTQAFAYNDLGLECSANGSAPVPVTCGSDWTPIDDDSEVLIQLQNCNRSRDQKQSLNILVEQEFSSYQLKFPFTANIHGYFIFCDTF